MSANWVLDIEDIHDKFGVNDAMSELTPNELAFFLRFKSRNIEREFEKFSYAKNAEAVVSSLINLCFECVSSLDALGVDTYEAWNRVIDANMAKERQLEPESTNPLDLPNLIKPEGWIAPTHEDNVGLLSKVLFINTVDYSS